MDNIYWTTEDPHFCNNETMIDYLNNVNLLDITLVDGTYAEGVNTEGERFEIHVGGDGDSYHHKASFKKINVY
jgi:hypothetical protein